MKYTVIGLNIMIFLLPVWAGAGFVDPIRWGRNILKIKKYLGKVQALCCGKKYVA